METEFTSVREETICSLEMLRALASLGGAKRANSEMVVDVGNATQARLSWGLEKALTV